ncbi:MAG: glycosyltransferase family 2 protein [Cyanobacteriota bacterium]|nr:glycosyltransferase family 2 protein [Cyanobacteriota bacterium]
MYLPFFSTIEPSSGSVSRGSQPPSVFVEEPRGALRIPGHLKTDRPPLFSLVVPTYNERENLPPLLDRLTQLLDRSLPGEYELIVVDDSSPDRTWEVAGGLMGQYPQLRVMRRQRERGLSTAIVRGWQVARGEWLGAIDADLQHPPQTLLQLLAELENGVDFALASRHVRNGGVSEWSFSRRFLSRGAQLLGLLILPEVLCRVSDPMSGYFIVRREAIADRRLDPVGYKIAVEVLGRGKIDRIAEVGYVFQERQEGASKVTLRQSIEYLQHLLRLRWHRIPRRRFLQFAIVGSSGVVVDLGVFHLLRGEWGWHLAASAILSTEVAILNNFIWNDRWTFGDIARKQRGWRNRVDRFVRFHLICGLGLAMNVAIVLGCSNLGINEYLSKLMAIVLVTLWNFGMNAKFGWRV